MADLKWVNTHVLRHTWARQIINDHGVIDQYGEDLLGHSLGILKSRQLAT